MNGGCGLRMSTGDSLVIEMCNPCPRTVLLPMSPTAHPCESREVRNTTSTIARDSSDLSRAWHRLLNYAVCASEKRGRECEPHRSRCPGIDDHPKLGRLFDRKIGG